MEDIADLFTASEDEQMVLLVSQHPALFDTKDPDYKSHAKKDAIWDDIGDILNKTRAALKRRWKNIKDNYFKQQKYTYKANGNIVFRRRNPLWKHLEFLNHVENKRSGLPNKEELQPILQQEIKNEYEDDDSSFLFYETQCNTAPKEEIEEFDDSLQEGNDQENNITTTISELCYETVVEENNENHIEETTSTSLDENILPTTSDLTTTSKIRPTRKRKCKLSSVKQGKLKKHAANVQAHMDEVSAPASMTVDEYKEDDIDIFLRSIGMTMKQFPKLLQAQTKAQIFSIVSQAELTMYQS